VDDASTERGSTPSARRSPPVIASTVEVGKLDPGDRGDRRLGQGPAGFAVVAALGVVTLALNTRSINRYD